MRCNDPAPPAPAKRGGRKRGRPTDRWSRDPGGSRRALWTYIRIYQFNGVVHLFARYGRTAPVGIDDRFVTRDVVNTPIEQSFNT
jgi:hypothetical protein